MIAPSVPRQNSRVSMNWFCAGATDAGPPSGIPAPTRYRSGQAMNRVRHSRAGSRNWMCALTCRPSDMTDTVLPNVRLTAGCGAGDGYFLHFARQDFEVEATEIATLALPMPSNADMPSTWEASSMNGLNIGNSMSSPCGTCWSTCPIGRGAETTRAIAQADGLLVIAVPNEGWPLFKARVGRGHIHPFGRLVPGKEIHLVHFTPGTLKRSLEKLWGSGC